jgi:hypothetical protein
MSKRFNSQMSFAFSRNNHSTAVFNTAAHGTQAKPFAMFDSELHSPEISPKRDLVASRRDSFKTPKHPRGQR